MEGAVHFVVSLNFFGVLLVLLVRPFFVAVCSVRESSGRKSQQFETSCPSTHTSLDAYAQSSFDIHQVKRIAKVAYDVAMKRGKRLCSVDKANVLDVSQVCIMLFRPPLSLPLLLMLMLLPFSHFVVFNTCLL